MVKKKESFWKQNNVVETIKFITVVGSIVGAAAFFVYTMQGLPPRVTKLEQDLPAIREQLKSEINDLKSQVDKNNAKTDIILDDVKVIKSLMMSKAEGK